MCDDGSTTTPFRPGLRHRPRSPSSPWVLCLEVLDQSDLRRRGRTDSHREGRTKSFSEMVRYRLPELKTSRSRVTSVSPAPSETSHTGSTAFLGTLTGSGGDLRPESLRRARVQSGERKPFPLEGVPLVFSLRTFEGEYSRSVGSWIFT